MAQKTRFDPRAMIRQEIRDHVMRETPVRAYSFTRPEGGSFYAFTLTWTPGHVALTGDLGDLALTHHAALRDFEAGMSWLSRSAYDYLMQKTELTRDQLDREQTVADIIEFANEEAVQARKDERQDTRRMRRARLDAILEGDIEDFDRRDYVQPAAFWRRDPGSLRGDSWRAPDGFGIWHRLYKALIILEDDPSMLLTAAGRRIVKSELESRIAFDSPEEIADLCHEIGLDDYHGSYHFPTRSVHQIEALKKGASMILDHLHPKRTWGRDWSDPVV